MHERMAFAIFRSPMSFFETTPSGRILNRFSRYVDVICSWSSSRYSSLIRCSDIYRVDEVLARTFNMVGLDCRTSTLILADLAPSYLSAPLAPCLRWLLLAFPRRGSLS